MFYNKEISIIEETEGYVDDYGIWHDGEMEVVDTIDCDVQPANAKQIYDDFGYQGVARFRVFADLNDHINLGAIIQYKGKNYKVIRLNSWDDYMDFIVDDVDVKVGENGE